MASTDTPASTAQPTVHAIIPHFTPIFARRRFHPAFLPNCWPANHLFRRTYSVQGIMISQLVEDSSEVIPRTVMTPVATPDVPGSADKIRIGKPRHYTKLVDGKKLYVYCTNELGWSESHFKETEVGGFLPE